MKYLIMILLIPILIQLLGCNNVLESDDEIEGIKEEYNEYHGYIYKGPKYFTDTTLAYHFFNKNNFDVLFHRHHHLSQIQYHLQNSLLEK